MLIGDVRIYLCFVFTVAIGGYEFVLRIALVESISKLRVADGVAARPVKVVLVANLNVMQWEGCRMSIACAFCAPLGAGVAGYVLDFIQCRLHVWFKILAGDMDRAGMIFILISSTSSMR